MNSHAEGTHSRWRLALPLQYDVSCASRSWCTSNHFVLLHQYKAVAEHHAFSLPVPSGSLWRRLGQGVICALRGAGLEPRSVRMRSGAAVAIERMPSCARTGVKSGLTQPPSPTGVSKPQGVVGIHVHSRMCCMYGRYLTLVWPFNAWSWDRRMARLQHIVSRAGGHNSPSFRAEARLSMPAPSSTVVCGRCNECPPFDERLWVGGRYCMGVGMRCLPMCCLRMAGLWSLPCMHFRPKPRGQIGAEACC